MTRNMKILGAAAMLSLLSGCGGGGGGGSDSDGGGTLFPGPGNTPPGETPLIPPEQEASERVFSDPSGTISDVFAADGVLFMRDKSRVSVAKSYTGALNYRNVDAQLSLEAEGSDLIVTMRVDGATEPFVVRIPNARSLTQERITVRDATFGSLTFYVRDGNISDLFDTRSRRYTRKLEVVLSNVDQDFAIDTMGVIGTETRDAMIATMASNNTIATYIGDARLNIRRTDQTFDEFNALAFGRLNLTANFGGSVQGSIDNINVAVRGSTVDPSIGSVAGSLVLSPATIQGNGFAGEMSADDTLLSSSALVGAVATGTYSGAFYGPEADEVGGAMKGPDPLGSSDFIGFGHFSGVKQ